MANFNNPWEFRTPARTGWPVRGVCGLLFTPLFTRTPQKTLFRSTETKALYVVRKHSSYLVGSEVG